MSPIIIILLIVLIFIGILYITNKKENMIDTDNVDKEINPIIGKPKLLMVPNCNMLNDRNVCSNTKGCSYDDTTLGCYYDWPNV